MTYGFIVVAWLITLPFGDPIPFYTLEACNEALKALTPALTAQEGSAYCFSTGVK